MAPNGFAWLPATDQLAAMDAKEVSSAELVDLYLSRIDEQNTPLNAIVTIDGDGARRAATEADAPRARGDELGPPGGDRTTVEFAALLTEVLGGYRVPPRYQTSDLTTTTRNGTP